MSKESNSAITEMLVKWSKGDKTAFDKLTELVYGELRRLAHRFMQNEHTGHTLQTTALIHEAYMKLISFEGAEEIEWEKPAQFFGLMAKVMRQILVDHARNSNRKKRGRGVQKVSLDEAVALSKEQATEIVALDEAMKNLEAIDPLKSQVVELRYFVGLSIEETAKALGISTTTVDREWRKAKAWLRGEIKTEMTTIDFK
jgi:RNA polymerase sigma-70 factor, ECF subfamily